MNGVKLLHNLVGCSIQMESWTPLSLIIRGVARQKSHKPTRARPITPSLLLQIYYMLDLRKDRDLSLWSSFLVAFYLMLRKSNVVPTSAASFDAHKHLSRKSFIIKNNVVFVKLQWSKTNQYGQRHLVLPLVSIPGHPLCPVVPLQRLIRRNTNSREVT